MERLELRAILDWKNASEVSYNWIKSILEVEWNPKYYDWLLKDFVNKAKKLWIDWIDFNAVELAFENETKKIEISEKIKKSWNTELKRFWERAKKLWKEFFKEVKKGKM
jgi:hypothetical protein